MERELRRELSAGHLLYEVPVRAVGRRRDQDDVLFAFDDATGRVAVVHLTWSQKAEQPPWPSTVVYPNFDAWLGEGMGCDHVDFHG